MRKKTFSKVHCRFDLFIRGGNIIRDQDQFVIIVAVPVDYGDALSGRFLQRFLGTYEVRIQTLTIRCGGARNISVILFVSRAFIISAIRLVYRNSHSFP